MVATDRFSALMYTVLIPYKGQILNQIANKFMELTQDIVPNWLIATPDPSCSGRASMYAFKVEMVIRTYLVTLHANIKKTN
jgi:phosphoribosylaminoimidazole-succinocarboxamide synthase